MDKVVDYLWIADRDKLREIKDGKTYTILVPIKPTSDIQKFVTVRPEEFA